MITVAVETPHQAAVAALLRQSDAVAAALYPGAFRRAIDPASLDRPGTTLLVARQAGRAAGCCALFDHGESEAIMAAHRVKTLTAIEQEAAAVADDPALVSLLAAACNRFLASAVRVKQPLRTARQALRLVADEAAN